MPATTLTLIGLLAGALLAGLVAGWLVRGRRSLGEKAAINAGWREQVTAQRVEHERLLEQNKSLSEQNSQFQASNKDSKLRAVELSSALKDAFERRDELQRQIKDIRGNLEVAVREREQLQSDIEHRSATVDETTTALRERDERIARLAKELKNWQERIPPLIERFRIRNREAIELEERLAAARDRIAALETMVEGGSVGRDPAGAATPGGDAPERDESAPSADRGAVAVEHSAATTAAVVEAPTDSADADADADAETATLAAGEVQVEANPAAADEFGRDDLQRIKGVGPAIEKTLNEMGIWRFDQIAAMSEYEIDRVAQRLKGFRSRIYREDWIGQARELGEHETGGQD